MNRHWRYNWFPCAGEGAMTVVVFVVLLVLIVCTVCR
jgi:hypothetical protein